MCWRVALWKSGFKQTKIYLFAIKLNIHFHLNRKNTQISTLKRNETNGFIVMFTVFLCSISLRFGVDAEWWQKLRNSRWQWRYRVDNYALYNIIIHTPFCFDEFSKETQKLIFANPLNLSFFLNFKRKLSAEILLWSKWKWRKIVFQIMEKLKKFTQKSWWIPKNDYSMVFFSKHLRFAWIFDGLKKKTCG